MELEQIQQLEALGCTVVSGNCVVVELFISDVEFNASTPQKQKAVLQDAKRVSGGYELIQGMDENGLPSVTIKDGKQKPSFALLPGKSELKVYVGDTISETDAKRKNKLPDVERKKYNEKLAINNTKCIASGRVRA